MRSKGLASWRQLALVSALLLAPCVHAGSKPPDSSSAIPETRTVVLAEDKKSGLRLPFFSSKDALAQFDASATDEEELRRLGEELQRVINERDALEQRLLNLKQATASPADRGICNAPTPYDAMLREFDPSIDNPRVREAIVIRNLRSALVQLAVKLKATEKAWELQAGKTRQVAGQLAALKQDPSILEDPSLVVPVVFEDPETIDWSKERNEREKTKQAREVFVYTPPEPSEDEASLRDRIRRNPADYEAYLRLADLHAGRRDLTQAENALTRLIARSPSHAEAYYYLTLVYMGQRKTLEATATLETYKRLNPSDTGRIRDLQAALHSRQGIQ